MKTLLFTGGGGAGSEALNRLLGDRYRVHFADADLQARPASIPPSNWHQIPFAAAPLFGAQLQHLCNRIRADAVIPGVDEELLAVAKLRGSINCEVLLPSEAFISTHLDKLASSVALRDAGLPTPATEWFPERSQIGFPCIAKPRSGRGSRGVAIVRSEQELQAHLLLSRRPAEDFILQELLEGQEYTVMVVADRSGGLRAVVPVLIGIKRGITLRARTDHDDAVERACRAIHAASPVPGCYNIQLVKDNDGGVKPFEINPRISTTACLGLAAGVDFIGLYFSESVSVSQTPLLVPFRDGLQLKRSWFNEFVE